jgi:hypothetical protein
MHASAARGRARCRRSRVVRVHDGDVDAVGHVAHVLGAVVVAGQDLVEAQARQLLVVIGAAWRWLRCRSSVSADRRRSSTRRRRRRHAARGRPVRTCDPVEHRRRFVHVAVGEITRSTGDAVTMREDRGVVRSLSGRLKSPDSQVAEGERVCAQAVGPERRGGAAPHEIRSRAAPAKCSCGWPRRICGSDLRRTAGR